MEYKLYNFDHSFKKPRNFQIGPFEISITETHCANIDGLYRGASTVFTSNGEKRIIEHKPKIEGSWLDTATVKIEDNDIKPSILFHAEDKKSNIDDLCLVLTFLTGRRVCTEDEFDPNDSKKYIDSCVSKSFFYDRENFWERLSIISEKNLEASFYNIAMGFSLCEELLGLFAYFNAALDGVSTKWCKSNNYTTFGNEELFKRIKLKFIETLTAILNELTDNKVDENVIQDIKHRPAPILAPSALYKLKKFLIANELYPEGDHEEPYDRLKWLNTIRNRIVHTGDLPSDKKYSYEMRAEISVNITFLVLSIVQYYFAAKVLGIEDSMLERMKKDIFSFFQKGEFRGKKVFDENFEEYSARIERSWTENGV